MNFLKKLYSFNQEEKIIIRFPKFNKLEDDKIITFESFKNELEDFFYKKNDLELIIMIFGIYASSISHIENSTKNLTIKKNNLDLVIKNEVYKNKNNFILAANNLMNYEKLTTNFLNQIKILRNNNLRSSYTSIKNNKNLIIKKNNYNKYLSYLNKLNSLKNTLNNPNFEIWKFIKKNKINNLIIYNNILNNREINLLEDLKNCSNDLINVVNFILNNDLKNLKFKNCYEIFEYLIKYYLSGKIKFIKVLTIFFDNYNEDRLNDIFKKILKKLFFEENLVSILDVKILINDLNSTKFQKIKEFVQEEIYLFSLNEQINKNMNKIFLELNYEFSYWYESYNSLLNFNSNLNKILGKEITFNHEFYIDKKLKIFIDNLLQNMIISNKYQINNNNDYIILTIFYFYFNGIIQDINNDILEGFFKYFYPIEELGKFMEDIESYLDNYYKSTNNANLFNDIKNIFKFKKENFYDILYNKLYSYHIINVFIYLVDLLKIKVYKLNEIINFSKNILEIILFNDDLDNNIFNYLADLKLNNKLNLHLESKITDLVTQNYNIKLKIFSKYKIFIQLDDLEYFLKIITYKQILDFQNLNGKLKEYNDTSNKFYNKEYYEIYLNILLN